MENSSSDDKDEERNSYRSLMALEESKQDDTLAFMENYDSELEDEDPMKSSQDSGLGKGSSTPQPAPTDEPSTQGSNCDISESAQLIAEAEKKKRKPSLDPSIASTGAETTLVEVPEESVAVNLLGSSIGGGPETPLPLVIEFLQAPLLLRDVEMIEVMDDTSPEAEPMEKRARQAETTPPPAQSSEQESFDHMFSEDGSADNPPATAEASGQLEFERAIEKEALKVSQEKAKSRARENKKLKSELEAAIRDNDRLQDELAASNHIHNTLREMRSELEVKLKKSQDDLKESHDKVEATEAWSILRVEYEKWKSESSTLDAAQRGIVNISAHIAEAKELKDRAKKILDDSSEEAPEESGSSDSVLLRRIKQA
ncbi:uncharacterized protein LOC132624082 [Lycium barbarum]|uniref:uncharacterized protein LOC132624082 n=1 Tax=Lycium barbarum TaxID=112863 RepID=UPI00293EEAF4|nr:uncharacterized protein LOC132624082 [Lycium barbarum]